LRPEGGVHFRQCFGQGILVLQEGAFTTVDSPVETLTLPVKAMTSSLAEYDATDFSHSLTFPAFVS
jgi:hypothetical protein